MDLEFRLLFDPSLVGVCNVLLPITVALRFNPSFWGLALLLIPPPHDAARLNAVLVNDFSLKDACRYWFRDLRDLLESDLSLRELPLLPPPPLLPTIPPYMVGVNEFSD